MRLDDNATGDAHRAFQTLKEKLQAIQMPSEQDTEPHNEGQPKPANGIEYQADVQQEPANIDNPASTDLEHPLANDPRTMWAWSEYKNSKLALPVSRQDAQQVLSAIPPGDHVEIFGAVTITQYYPRRDRNALPLEARFAARTFHSWILPTSGAQPETIAASNTKWGSSMGGSIVDPVAESHFSLPDKRHLYAYADNRSYGRYDEGAGQNILRLPGNPWAPAPPEVGKTPALAYSESAPPVRLVGDWRTAEDLALWHMAGPLGFFGSRLTGGVSDGGIDVEHPEAVAQVKMQANPVGSPLIRQLRGTLPHLANHIFYSTSGYTSAAIAEAAETGVALFALGHDATIHAHGAHAARLILSGHIRHGGIEALVADYIKAVTDRVCRAETNYCSMATDTWLALREAYKEDKHQVQRAEKYLKDAANAVKRHPRIGDDTHKAVLSHFRNADLKAAFFCHVLGLPYPGEVPLKRVTGRSTAADFY